MIQRKQTLWLFIAALISAGLLYFNLYSAHIMVNGADTIALLRVNDHYPSLLLAIILIILPVISIFMYGKRKQQRSMTIVSILAAAGFISMLLWRVTSFNKANPTATGGTYGVGAVLPVLAIIFLILAIRGINKDIKLVKSLDRLR